MSTNAEKLSKQFSQENRFDVFGPVITCLEISGVKGTNCKITFDYPVTAIAGFNGAGKSTIAQIALCMYRALDKKKPSNRKYLKDFFVKTLLDKTPYNADARIKVHYASDHSSTVQLSIFEEENAHPNEKTLDVHYSIDRWAGYKHQPQKAVYYYGMSYFIPYQEQNSNLLRDSNADITKSIILDKQIVETVADILSIRYKGLQNNSITNEKRTENVISAQKASASYSENHMGCGEGRLLKLVYALETAQDQSLFVIEEPETALHELAQHKLAQYFLDVCNRKKHQIIFTTYSAEILSSLPSEARKYIRREEDGTTSVVKSPSIAQIRNYLSGGYEKKMIIVTEDDIGKLYVMEILRRYGRDLFNNSMFFSMKLSYAEVKKFVEQSQNCGIKIFGVVDENRRKDTEKYVSAFPEDTPPEISFLRDSSVIDLVKTEFGYDCTNLPNDHHLFFDVIAEERNDDVIYVKNRCIKTYVKNKGSEYYQEIISVLSNWLAEC